MPVYIKASAAISPQNSFKQTGFPDIPVSVQGNSLRCIEPDYSVYVGPVQIRRMTRIVKMGIAASKEALKTAGVENPDAIIVGTGLGCLEETEKFLRNMLDTDEQTPAPTQFINSTHNSIAGQIALQIKCLGYNYTYVHKGFSFLSALDDACLQIELHGAKNVLLGGTDEFTESKHHFYDLIGYWKKDIPDSLSLYNHRGPGSIDGEGSAFFVLSSDAAGAVCQITDTASVYGSDAEQIRTACSHLLGKNGLTPADVNIVLTGRNGDERFDGMYDSVCSDFTTDTSIARFKHLCGSYYTADAFACWLASEIFRTNTLPEYCIERKGNKSHKAKHILLYNHFRGKNHVFILLSAA
jgi:3-oxoacyl-(acyl-carrier-protein) synthase